MQGDWFGILSTSFGGCGTKVDKDNIVEQTDCVGGGSVMLSHCTKKPAIRLLCKPPDAGCPLLSIPIESLSLTTGDACFKSAW